MFAVRGVPPLLILLAILAPASLATSINYEDLEPAATSHSHGYEEGGGSDRYSNHADKGGDRFDNGYESYHEVEESGKGHHNLDNNRGYYSEDGGGKTNDHRDDGYYDEHHEGEEGENGERFHDKGHYGKGHSTHGHHEVKRLDEFEKHKEFHDEDYDSGFNEDDGGHHYGHERQKGGSYKEGHRDHSEHEADHGNEGRYAKGHHYNDHKGHDSDGGHENYYRNDYRHGKKGSRDDGRKWGYKEGH